jgi:hypothetical protein
MLFLRHARAAGRNRAGQRFREILTPIAPNREDASKGSNVGSTPFVSRRAAAMPGLQLNGKDKFCCRPVMAAAPPAETLTSLSVRIMVERFLAARRCLTAIPNPTSTTGLPLYFFYFLHKKQVMKKIKKIQQQARRLWFLWVGSHWEQHIQRPISERYYWLVEFPVGFWVACGCPRGFRPQLPWWHRLAWQYLLLTGWRRRQCRGQRQSRYRA